MFSAVDVADEGLLGRVEQRHLAAPAAGRHRASVRATMAQENPRVIAALVDLGMLSAGTPVDVQGIINFHS